MFGLPGLRTQIVLNSVFLMCAALMFSGFLLLKQMERELVNQRERNANGISRILARALSQNLSPENFAPRAASLAKALVSSEPVAEWAIVDKNLVPINLPGVSTSFQLDFSYIIQARETGNELVNTRYSPIWMPALVKQPAIFVTIPFFDNAQFAGAFQARFPLHDVQQRLASAQNTFLFYIFFYGAILVLFGMFLMGRTVVNPVRRLVKATHQIAAGDFNQALRCEGPAEIVELARSFNSMATALREKRHETDSLIQALHQKNEDLLRTQSELVRAERMASVGHLAAGLAHEVGNPLGAIIGYIELLRSELPPGREREIASRAGTEAQRIHALIRELLDYAQPEVADLEPSVSLTVLSEAVDLLTHQGALTDIRVVNDLPSILSPVGMARHRLLQVFVNLLVNARDAIRSSSRGVQEIGGTIRLTGGEDAEEVWLAISDNGCGIDPAVLPHIFDPFFTTKAPGEGRGLGLAFCQRIVAEAGGRMTVGINEGGGSTFTVRLPRVAAEAA